MGLRDVEGLDVGRTVDQVPRRREPAARQAAACAWEKELNAEPTSKGEPVVSSVSLLVGGRALPVLAVPGVKSHPEEVARAGRRARA